LGGRQTIERTLLVTFAHARVLENRVDPSSAWTTSRLDRSQRHSVADDPLPKVRADAGGAQHIDTGTEKVLKILT
jgi:hypothetical protein